MANNTDIVKEIESQSQITLNLNKKACLNKGAQCLVTSTELVSLYGALQRARDALRWIPCEERLPEKEGYYLVTFETGSVEIDYFIPGHGFDCSPSCPVIAWKERTILSAYTPEEK